MTAADIIDQIKALPPDERRKVIEFIASAQKTGADDGKAFVEAARWVFEEHAELMRKLSQ